MAEAALNRLCDARNAVDNAAGRLQSIVPSVRQEAQNTLHMFLQPPVYLESEIAEGRDVEADSLRIEVSVGDAVVEAANDGVDVVQRTLIAGLVSEDAHESIADLGGGAIR